jgi:hypothetical protein
LFAKAFYDTDKYFDLYDEILNLDLPSIFHAKDTKDNAEKIGNMNFLTIIFY